MEVVLAALDVYVKISKRYTNKRQYRSHAGDITDCACLGFVVVGIVKRRNPIPIILLCCYFFLFKTAVYFVLLVSFYTLGLCG